jgi:Cytochrome P460
MLRCKGQVCALSMTRPNTVITRRPPFLASLSCSGKASCILGRGGYSIAVIGACLFLLTSPENAASSSCPDEQRTSQVPKDVALCAKLEQIVRKPHALPLDEYEAKLGDYLSNFCHRDLGKGWKVDKQIRNTGPYVAWFRQGQWWGESDGTHPPALVWYSPDMYQWLRTNRSEMKSHAKESPVPDGAIIVKEMYYPPETRCAGISWDKLRPNSEGATVMVRDSKGSHDGWFWGWFGWTEEWRNDWPYNADSRSYPFMGFGLYCTNCHSSAKSNETFSSLRNIQGEPGKPLVFLSQNSLSGSPSQNSLSGSPSQNSFSGSPSQNSFSAPLSENSLSGSVLQSLHMRVIQSNASERLLQRMPDGGQREPPYDSDFVRTFQIPGGRPERNKVPPLPSETYDHVWARASKSTSESQFLTSDQCLGCHNAGGTGLQFDMTEPGSDDKLINISPYGSWRGSPMALSGRDPIFFAQLESESGGFHPQAASTVDDACSGCHGVMGQRQFAIDRKASTGICTPFGRQTFNAVPFPRDNELNSLSNYGALARDGVSCMSCHQAAIGTAESAKALKQPQNICIEERQELFNPKLMGFARTFTGAFPTGSLNKANGPFRDPKQKPMRAAVGINPVYNESVKSSEVCGSCHTVHLPVLKGNQTIARAYEQTTYPEWAFSAYRTGYTPDGPLPLGAGAAASSCQGCHMPDKDASGHTYRSKIAAIQEYSNFPLAENVLESRDIDLPPRPGFAKHTLLGLNFFLLKIAEQFADLLGIRLVDPMLSDKGVNSIESAQRDMLEQAGTRTATVLVSEVKTEGDVLNARVEVANRTGHKFPSGVGFRRAFIEFNILDADGEILWSSGRTNGAGVVVDQNDKPIAGELWWKDDCSDRIDPMSRLHQPHYEVISRQDQAQIYEELVSAPSDVEAPQCGSKARPGGPLTTSFLSICTRVKDNRLLPHGFLSVDERKQIATAIGAGPDLAEEAGPVAVENDPDYRDGGGDTIIYRVPISEINGRLAAVQATLYYQATPPYYLQDRFCMASGADTQRLYYVAGKLNLTGTSAQGWKFRVVTSGLVTVH